VLDVRSISLFCECDGNVTNGLLVLLYSVVCTRRAQHFLVVASLTEIEPMDCLCFLILTSDGWWLAAGSWRLAAGGWRLTAGGWRLVVTLDSRGALADSRGALAVVMSQPLSCCCPLPPSIEHLWNSMDLQGFGRCLGGGAHKNQ